MLGSVIRSLNTLRIARWRAELRASWVASSQVLMALITPALAWVLMGQIGILGAGVAWVVGQGVVASIGSVAGRQRTSSGAPGRDSGTPEVLRADPALGL
jgi:O-antigen/teichoic acid export membrane protein